MFYLVSWFFLIMALCRMFLPPEAKKIWTFGLIFYFYTMENDAFGMDLLVLNHKKFPDKFLIWKHKVIWKPKELFKTGGIFLKILEILLKTGGIFKNRWNQKPVEFFFEQKNRWIFFENRWNFFFDFFHFFFDFL